jgi:tRNA (guanine6-N2)-methyltransferase
MKKYSSTKRRPHAAPAARRIEVIVPEGLEPLARRELRRLGPGARLEPGEPPGVIAMSYSGELRPLLGLRSVTSVYLAHTFPVPRPKALLGDEQFRAAVAACEAAMGLHPAGSFRTLFLSAAGADSAVLGRLKQELVARLGLEVGAEDGDLLLRLRRGAGGAGWDLLVRLSPRPLATRPWRVCNLEGALNGPVAHAMAALSEPAPGDRYLNIGCGSGTLLVERLLLGPARCAIGCDTSPAALACAAANLEAAGLAGRAELHPWDARSLPLADGAVDVVTADLPFGHLVGSHAENLTLYPALLAEAARAARPGARAALLTHEVRLMEGLLAGSPAWEVASVTRVDVGGLYPRIFLLRRR